MNQSNVTSKVRARFTVRRKPSRTGRGEWCVIDRQARKVDSRYINEATARQVAEELSAIDRDRLADGLWPLETYSERWTLVTPEIAPAEEQALEEPTADDREWWAQQDREAESDPLLAGFDSPLMAFLDRMGPDSWEEQDVREFAR